MAKQVKNTFNCISTKVVARLLKGAKIPHWFEINKYGFYIHVHQTCVYRTRKLLEGLKIVVTDRKKEKKCKTKRASR